MRVLRETFSIPSNVPAGQYYVVYSIDAFGAVSEFLEGNNRGAVTDEKFTDPYGPIHFVEVSASVGLAWRHDNGMTPERHFPETMGGGGAHTPPV